MNSYKNSDNLAVKTGNPSLLFRLLLIIVLIIQVAKIIHNPVLESRLFSLTFILLIGCIVTMLVKNPKVTLPYRIAAIIITLIMVSTIFSLQEFSISYFNKAFIFIATILCFLFVSEFPMDRRICKWIYIISFVQSVVFIIAYYLGYRYPYGITSALSFGFANPNFTGMWLLHLVCINTSFIFERIAQKKYYQTVGILIVMVFNAFFIISTDNRSSIIGLLCLIIGIVLTAFSNKKVPKIPAAIVAGIPVVIAIIYLIFVNSGMINIFNTFSGVGKELTSRVGIWTEGINIIKTHPFFGEYYTVLYRLSFSQLHNMYIDLATSYGIPVAVLFFFFLKNILKKAQSNVQSKQQNIAYWGVFAILLTSSFEAALVSGSTGMYVMSCSLIILILQYPSDQSAGYRNTRTIHE